MDALVATPWRQLTSQQNPADREFISLSDITRFLRLYLRVIAGCVITALLGAWFYIATTDPSFTATTRILIEPKIPQVLQPQGAEVNLSLDSAQIESQIAVMESEKIAQMVIDRLELKDDPAFNRPAAPTMADRLLKTKAAAVERFGLKDRAWYRWLEEAAVRRFGNWRSNDEPPQLSEFERGRRTMEIFRNGLEVKRRGVSYAIDISFNSPDPEGAANVANATADALVREQIETKAEAAREGGAWLERRLKELRSQMNTATQVAQAFRAKHDYRVGPATGASLVDGKVVFDDELPRVEGPTVEELEVTADTYRQMYESFLQAFTNSVSQQSYPVADARVITEATPPLVASHPRRKLVLGFGALAGVIAGIGLAFLRHTLDRKLRTPQQIRAEFGLECVGELPVTRRNSGFGSIDEVVRYPRSRFTSSLMDVRTAINVANAGRSMRCVGITSALPEDGKSSCASNLAILYSMSGMKTLLIDADVDHATLTKKLLPLARSVESAERCRSEVMTWQVSETTSLDVRPCSAADCRNLLAARNMQALLPDMQAYDVVIVDLPPLTSGSDTLAIASLLDGVVLVAEWGSTPVDVLREFVRSLHAHKVSVIGVVMTKVRMMSTKRHKRYGSRLPARHAVPI